MNNSAIIDLFPNLRKQVENLKEVYEQSIRKVNLGDSSDDLERAILFLKQQKKVFEEYVTMKKMEMKHLEKMISSLKAHNIESTLCPDFQTQRKHPYSVLINLSSKCFAKKKHPLQDKLKKFNEKFDKGDSLTAETTDTDTSDDDTNQEEWFNHRIVTGILEKSIHEVTQLKMRNESMGFKEVSYEYGIIPKAWRSANHDSKKVPSFGDIMLLDSSDSDPVVVTGFLPCPPTNVHAVSLKQTFNVSWDCRDNFEVQSSVF